jgi:hypothetical protein
MKTMVLGLLMFGTVLAGSASAESFRRDQWDSHARIASGSRSGRLTPREAARLRREQERINRQYLRDRWDGGGLSYRERRELQRKQERLNRRLYRDSRDWDGPWGRGRW